MPRNSVAYDDDFFAWTQEQARLLRDGDLADIDVENLAEEIESMGKSDRREIRNRLVGLLAYLLKWQFQPGGRSKSWTGTIIEQRHQLKLVVDDSPSLRRAVPEYVNSVYGSARNLAAVETDLAEAAFPVECPFTPDQILSEDFLPE
jgi:Domain of unknown function DUF29